eukprot:6181029-Pleurochrysis_carterae.AAC.1
MRGLRRRSCGRQARGMTTCLHSVERLRDAGNASEERVENAGRASAGRFGFEPCRRGTRARAAAVCEYVCLRHEGCEVVAKPHLFTLQAGLQRDCAARLHLPVSRSQPLVGRRGANREGHRDDAPV